MDSARVMFRYLLRDLKNQYIATEEGSLHAAGSKILAHNARVIRNAYLTSAADSDRVMFSYTVTKVIDFPRYTVT